MKLRIFTSMMVVVFLSLFGAFSAQAGDCGKSACHHGHHWTGHRNCCGHNGYIYGPDGHYAKCKSACEKKCESKSSCCEKKASCGASKCANSCRHTYTRARYHEDCCGHGHLHYGSCKNRDNDNDD